MTVFRPDPEPTGNPEYDALPASIRSVNTYQEWLFMTDTQKNTLVRRETEPHIDYED